MTRLDKMLKFGFVGVAVGIAFGVGFVEGSKPATAPPTPIGIAEVSDLLTHLKPLVKEPNGPWYNNGVELTFYGRGVHLKLKLPNGNEYHGRANTLREAVARITEPSVDIQNALKGWSVPQ